MAAAGIYALKEWRSKLIEDHEKMQYIASHIEEVGKGGKIKIS